MHNKDASAIVVVPRKPFIDWVNWVYQIKGSREMTTDYFLSNCSILLIPKFSTMQEAGKYIDSVWNDIFSRELERYDAEPFWMNSRSKDTFREWFSLKFHSNVYTSLIADQ